MTTINGELLSYNLYHAEEGQNLIRISFPVSTLGPYTYVLTQLNPNTRYSFFLSVVNNIGEGPNSTLIWQTTYPVGESYILIHFQLYTIVFGFKRAWISDLFDQIDPKIIDLDNDMVLCYKYDRRSRS